MFSIKALQQFPGRLRSPLISIALMLFFWALVDALISYFVPILIIDKGYTQTDLGWIIATSSVFGGMFDFVVSKILKISNYQKIFLTVFVIYIFFPLILWRANTFFILFFCMMLWGLYYDLLSFGSFNFITRKTSQNHHSHGFGVIDVFRTLGYLLGPLIAGLLFSEGGIDNTPYFAIFFLTIGFIFLLIDIFTVRYKKSINESFENEDDDVFEKRSFYTEFLYWIKTGKKLRTVLLFIIVYLMVDAVVWTIGPLLSLEFKQIPGFGGLFVASAVIPGVITGWFVGRITNKYGKKKTAYIAFIISCVVRFSLGFTNNPYLILIIMFTSSLIASFSWPAIAGAFADYLAESKHYDNEILGLQDFASNVSYIIGPVLAGMLSDSVGILATFSYTSVIGIIIGIFLLIVTPKEIKIE